jgi:hypothetical protein
MNYTINPAYIVNVFEDHGQEFVCYLNPKFEEKTFETWIINTQTGQGHVHMVSPIDRPFLALVKSVRREFKDSTLAHLQQFPN